MEPIIDPKLNKISAIKAVRTFTEQTFGIYAGLKISKAFIDDLISQIAAVQIEELEKNILAAKANGITVAQMREILDRYDY